jgi:hypothetical protein
MIHLTAYPRRHSEKGEGMDDTHHVLAALRLGWSVAEMRGRNRPDGPPGEVVGMPDHVDCPLPLRIERGKTELRIEIQSVVAELAQELRVDDAPDGTSYSAALGDKTRRLAHARAPKAADALRQALDLVQQAAANQEEALQALNHGLAVQQAVVARRRQALAAAQFARAPEAALQNEQASCAGEEAGAAALEQVIGILRQSQQGQPTQHSQPSQQGQPTQHSQPSQQGQPTQHSQPSQQGQPSEHSQPSEHGQPAAAEAIGQHLRALTAAARQPWADLAELMWQFDAHVQDRLAALSESQAIGYQLGRGLADTYWALNPGQEHGSASWSFLLGERRCGELSRLTGRLAVYMGEYTASAIAGSLEVWKAVVAAPVWLGHPDQADVALYSQIRRWYELIILGQDPTTLIGPAAVMRNYRTLARALQLFWPQLLATTFGLAALVTLLFLVNVEGATAWEKTLSGVVAAVGLSLAGLTGTLKNSAQALLKRLRQDAYTDLVAIAVQTAPPPPDKSALQRAISRRTLTPVTPN